MTDRRSKEGSERLRELHHAATDIMAAPDVPSVYQTTVKKAKTVLGFDFCTVFVRTEDGFEIVASSHHEVGEIIPERDGILERTFRERDGFIVRDIPSSAGAKPLEDGFGSGISVPVGEKAVLQAASRKRGYYEESDLELAELLAVHAKAARKQARSHELVRNQKHKIEELHAVATDLESCQLNDELFELMREASKEILGFDWCTLYVLKEGKFVTAMTSEESPVVVGEKPFTQGESKAREVLERGESNLVEDLHAIDEGEPTTDRIRAALQVPVGDIGVYNAAHERPGMFDQDDVELAELLASSVAEAYDRINAQERLRSQKRKLQQKNERLDQFASLVSHDLRNPLTVAQLRADLIDNDDEHTDAVLDALDRMETMIDEMLGLARAGQNIETTEQCRLTELVENAWDNVQTAESELDANVEDTTLEADATRLLQVFENLFRNARDHNAKPLVVRVGLLESRDGFYVEDDGDGIPEGERNDVFDQGYTTSEAGSGLGLTIVSDILKAHGWSIIATESEAGGARFEIRTG